MFTKAALIAVAAAFLFSAASSSFDQLIRHDPNDAESFNDRWIAYAGKRQLDRAIEDYDQAIRLNPNDAVSFKDRGNAYAAKGLLDRAIEDYDQAIPLNPNFAGASSSTLWDSRPGRPQTSPRPDN